MPFLTWTDDWPPLWYKVLMIVQDWNPCSGLVTGSLAFVLYFYVPQRTVFLSIFVYLSCLLNNKQKYMYLNLI